MKARLRAFLIRQVLIAVKTDPRYRTEMRNALGMRAARGKGAVVGYRKQSWPPINTPAPPMPELPDAPVDQYDYRK